MEARTLLLDEPTASITPHEVEYLFDVLRRLRDQGVAILFVSHKLEEVFDLCDHVTVLRDGQAVASGEPLAGMTRDRVRTLMVGRSEIIKELPPKEVAKTSPCSRCATCAPNRAATTSPSDPSGEIVGLYGLVGAGPDRAGASTHRSRPVDRRRDPRQGEAGTHPQRARRPGDHRIGT